MCSKVLSICRRRRRLISPLPKDVAISYQASRMRSKRRPVRGFEPGIMFGTKVETIKFYFSGDFQGSLSWEKVFALRSPCGCGPEGPGIRRSLWGPGRPRPVPAAGNQLVVIAQSGEDDHGNRFPLRMCPGSCG